MSCCAVYQVGFDNVSLRWAAVIDRWNTLAPALLNVWNTTDKDNAAVTTAKQFNDRGLPSLAW